MILKGAEEINEELSVLDLSEESNDQDLIKADKESFVFDNSRDSINEDEEAIDVESPTLNYLNNVNNQDVAINEGGSILDEIDDFNLSLSINADVRHPVHSNSTQDYINPPRHPGISDLMLLQKDAESASMLALKSAPSHVPLSKDAQDLESMPPNNLDQASKLIINPSTSETKALILSQLGNEDDTLG